MFLQNISTRMTLTATNQLTNNLGRIGKDITKDSIAPFNLENLPRFYQNAKKGVRINIRFKPPWKPWNFSRSVPASTSMNFGILQGWTGCWSYGQNARGKDTLQGFNSGDKLFRKCSLQPGFMEPRFLEDPPDPGHPSRDQSSIGLSFQPTLPVPTTTIINASTSWPMIKANVYKSRHDGFI